MSDQCLGAADGLGPGVTEKQHPGSAHLELYSVLLLSPAGGSGPCHILS